MRHRRDHQRDLLNVQLTRHQSGAPTEHTTIIMMREAGHLAMARMLLPSVLLIACLSEHETVIRIVVQHVLQTAFQIVQQIVQQIVRRTDGPRGIKGMLP